MGYYAGTGARRTPPKVCLFFTALAAWLEKRQLILRSGGADGADTAFEKGVVSCDNRKIFRPRTACKEALALAESFHPAWRSCTEFAKRLHGRNAMIILGEDLTTPAKFVVCWTPHEDGGAALGIRIAQAYNIPVYNIYDKDYNLASFCGEIEALLTA